MRVVRAVSLALVALACRERPVATPTDLTGDPPPPRWNFGPIVHNLTDVPLTDLWARSDGTIVVVGHYGTILRGVFSPEQPNGVWSMMASPTDEHLTAVSGVENGQRFGLPDADGEMVAVGWNGTILHYHPNPDGVPTTADGTWSAVSLPGGQRLPVRVQVDRACPDYDGDGVRDDGDGDGFWGNAVCTNNQTAACDDNCREAANGTLRPTADLNGDACMGPGDGPDPDLTKIQRDDDGDGRGLVCDDDDSTPAAAIEFNPTLFDVWVYNEGPFLQIVAVGEDGAMVGYTGPNAADAVTQGVAGPTAPDRWIAQTGLPFRYVNDCPPGTPPGTVCAGSGRLPPSCPAQCNVVRTTCNCPVAQGQCCDAAASTGVGCAGGTCAAADNGCDTATGLCSNLCPSCFRRLNETLRSISGSRTGGLVAVGSSGSIVVGDAEQILLPWQAPSCSPPPPPYDERPLLTSINQAAGGGAALAVGAAGAMFYVDAGLPNNCSLTSQLGAPPAFLSGAFSTGGPAYVVGDRGLLMEVDPGQNPPVESITTGIAENLFAVWVNADPTFDPLLSTGPGTQIWVVGASGTIYLGRYF